MKSFNPDSTLGAGRVLTRHIGLKPDLLTINTLAATSIKARAGFKHDARGFAIVTAIFILVVLAVLGAFMVNVSSNQHIGSALDVQGVRAYQAARTGIEWGLFQVQSTAAYNFSYGTPATAVGAGNPNARACPASPTSFVPAAPSLAGFTVTVTCAATADANGGPTIYSITSTACNAAGACPSAAPGNFYVERRLDVSF